MSKTVVGINQCRALVVDPVPMSRSVLTAQLRACGVVEAVQCGRLDEARRLIQARKFDVVLCEMDFHAGGGNHHSGQDFLEDVRRERIVPLVTVFIMVTSENSYTRVAEAAETALDSYLLKPFTAAELQNRVEQSLHRKSALRSIFDAIERDDFKLAARECILRFRERGRYWIYAARLGAELLLRLDMHAQAQQLLEAVCGAHALPWARLGLAQSQLATQQNDRALCTLELLIHDEPGYADAYDVMGRAQVALGDFDEALLTYERAVRLTPGALHRQQALGMLAYYCGDNGAARRALERSMVLGRNNRDFDPQSIVLLSALQFHDADAEGLQRSRGQLEQAADRAPGKVRLRRMVDVVSVFDLMLQRQVARVLTGLKAMVGEMEGADFDTEAACNLMILLARLTAAELELADTEDWVSKLATRFCSHRATTEMMVRAAQAHPPFETLVRQAHAKVLKLIQRALTYSIKGDPGSAVDLLLEQARQTLNLKFLETAQGVMQRYGAEMPDTQRRQAAVADVARQLAGAAPQTAREPALA